MLVSEKHAPFARQVMKREGPGPAGHQTPAAREIDGVQRARTADRRGREPDFAGVRGPAEASESDPSPRKRALAAFPVHDRDSARVVAARRVLEKGHQVSAWRHPRMTEISR